MNDWLGAIIAIAAAIVIGSVVSRVARGALGRDSNPEAVRQNAGAIASIIFSVILVIGLIVALGLVRPEALDQITDDAVAYLPRALAAGVVVIVGNILATIAAQAAAQAVARSGARAAHTIPAVIRGAIVGFALILAASQLGVDTTVINIAVSAMLFSVGLAMALLVGLGGHTVSSQIAAGRALRRMLEPGDIIDVRGDTALNGTVLTVHSTAVEIDVDGASMLVPNADLLEQHLTVTRSMVADSADQD